MAWLMVLIGGICGALVRYKINIYTSNFYLGTFPLATLCVNLVGSFLMGVLFAKVCAGYSYALLGTGFLGGLTTFSTMNFELLDELRNKQYLIFISYFVLTYLGGFTLLLIGYILAK